MLNIRGCNHALRLFKNAFVIIPFLRSALLNRGSLPFGHRHVPCGSCAPINKRTELITKILLLLVRSDGHYSFYSLTKE